MRIVRPALAACLIVGLAVMAATVFAQTSSVEPVQTSAPETTAPAKPAAKPGKPEVDSLAMLEKAVAKDSTKFDNLYKLGVMYLDRDKPAEATRVLARAVKIKPKSVKAQVNLGAAYDALGNADAAQKHYRAALAISAGDSVAQCRLASSLYSQGKHQEAMDILRETIADKPGSYCAYFTLGVAFADAGIYRDAVRMWQQVIKLAPDSPEAISAKESIEVLEKFTGN